MERGGDYLLFVDLPLIMSITEAITANAGARLLQIRTDTGIGLQATPKYIATSVKMLSIKGIQDTAFFPIARKIIAVGGIMCISARI